MREQTRIEAAIGWALIGAMMWGIADIIFRCFGRDAIQEFKNLFTF